MNLEYLLPLIANLEMQSLNENSSPKISVLKQRTYRYTLFLLLQKNISFFFSKSVAQILQRKNISSICQPSKRVKPTSALKMLFSDRPYVVLHFTNEKLLLFSCSEGYFVDPFFGLSNYLCRAARNWSEANPLG